MNVEWHFVYDQIFMVTNRWISREKFGNVYKS